MKKFFKLVGVAAFTLLLFIVVAASAFYHLVRVGDFRRFLISQIEQSTQFKVQLGEGDLNIGRILGVTFRDVAISEPDTPQPEIRAARITARVALWPLFRRRVVLYEIQLEKPMARVERDREGKFPLLERLLNLPFAKGGDNRFVFDLRAIKIAAGQVSFKDEFKGGVAGTTELRDIELRLDRIRGRALGAFVRNLVRKPSLPGGTALDFDLKSSVARERQSAQIRVQGTMVFPSAELQLQNAWWTGKTQIAAMPASMIQTFFAASLPVRKLAGSADATIQMEGTPNERLHLQGQLSFKGLAVDAPEIFSAPLQPADSSVQFEGQWQPNEWDLARFEWRSPEINFALRGGTRAAVNRERRMALSLTTGPAKISTIKKYLPTKWLAFPQVEKVAAAVQEGEVQFNKAGVNATISDLKRMAVPDEHVWFNADVRNVAANFGGGYLPLRNTRGRIALEAGVLSFMELAGQYGQSRFANMNGSYRFSAEGGGALQLQARGEADLAELRDQLNQGIFPPALTKAASAIQDIGGKATFAVGVSKAPLSSPQMQGTLAFDGARLQFDNLFFSDVKGDLAFSPTEIKAGKILALISGSPIQIQLTLNDYATDNGTFDVAVDSGGIKAGIVTRLLLNSGSLQDPGIVRGSIRYLGPLGRKENRKFTANFDLANVQLATKPLLQPLRDLNGSIKIDESGIDFRNVKGSLVGFPASFSGRWQYGQKPQLLFNFTAPNLDITYLLSQIDPEATDFYANLEAEGNIALNKGRVRSFEFSDFKSAVTIDHRVWRFSNPVMQSDGGSIQGVMTLIDKPEVPGFSMAPKIQGVPVQSFLRWFDISNKEITGKVNLTGQFESVGKDGGERKKNLNGAFNLKIEDGIIHRLRIVVQILNLLDLSRWFSFKLPDVNKEGIRFRRISGDFKVVKGVYSTDNLLVDSDDLRMSGAGKIDAPKNEIDFLIAVRPFAGIDTAINYIPILGRGIAAIKNSFLVASFHITGSIDEPTIIPAPLSTISEWFFGVLGIPKHMIGFGDDETNEETQKEQPRESQKPPAPSP